MATLADLYDGGELEKFEPVLDPGEQVWRYVYLLPKAKKWIDNNRGSGLRDYEDGIKKIRGIMSSYCAGHRIFSGLETRHLNPKDSWCFEFKSKPPGAIRAFGWPYDQRTFVVAFLKPKSELSEGYKEEIAETVQARNNLPLDEPKVLREKNLDKLMGRVSR